MTTAVGATERYFAEFARMEPVLAGAQIAWLRAARRRALNRFGEAGFPTLRDEEWKYTNIAPIENRVFRTAQRSDNGLEEAQLAALRFNGLRCHELVFINGHHAKTRSNLGPLPRSVRVESLATMLMREPTALSDHIHRYTEQPAGAFVALNAVFMTDGAYISLPDNVVIKQPIHLVFVSTGQDKALASYSRILIAAGANTRVTIIESYCGLNANNNLTNTLTEIIAGQNAYVEHYKVQMESIRAYHIGNLFIQQGEHSQVISHSIALGAALARNDIVVKLDAKGAAITLNGLYMAKGRQHIDHHTRIDHLKPHTKSEELYKGILDGYARGVFNGKVRVHQDAQKVDAHQSNKNLLLSENAEVDTKPELQIYADDVKCTHGATVGQLDENALFYLRSRGIDQETARGLLTYAFADDVITRIGIEPIRSRLERIIAGQLPDSDRIKEFV